MNKLKLISAMTLTSLLAACGGSGDADRQTPDIDIPTAEPTIAPPEYRIPTTQAHIPFLEDFNGASDTAAFFDAAYKELGGDYPGEDEFFFSTAGVFDSEGNLDPSGGNWITADSDQSFRLGNARFSMAQIAPLEGDARTKTTVENETILRGEMDLSQPYRLSFCVVDSSGASSGSSGFELYVDNNSSGKSAESIHGASSRVLKLSTNQFIAGKRAEINIPGDTILDGAGTVVSTGTINPGLDTSFLQIRVSSGGYIVIDDMVIEYQSDTSLGDAQTGCDTKTTDYATENPWVDALPTAEPTVEPTVEPTQPPVSGDVAWTTYNGDVTPTTTASVTLSDSSTSEFADSDSNAATTWTSASGIASFVSTTAETKSRITFADIVGDTFPKTFTFVSRIKNSDNTNRGVEIEAAFGGEDIGDGSGSAGRVKFMVRESKIQLEKYDGTNTAEFSMDTSTDYHIYQIAVTLDGPRTATIDTWVDGVAVPDMSGLTTTGDLRDVSGGTNSIWIGDNSGGNLFNADIDYAIWTVEAAYSPGELKGKLPANIGDITGYEPDTATVSWDAVFSGDATPTTTDSVTLSDSTTSEFADSDSNAATTWTSASGIASFVSTAAETKSRITFADIVGDTFPKTFTFVSRIKNSDNTNRGVEIEAAFGGEDVGDGSGSAGRVKFMVRESKIQLEKYDGTNTAEFSMDTSTDYHIYQIAVTLDGPRTATIDTWVDGVAVADMSGLTTTGDLRDVSGGTNSIWIGDNSGGNLFNADIDYAIWTTEDAYTAAELVGQLPANIGDTSGYQSLTL